MSRVSVEVIPTKGKKGGLAFITKQRAVNKNLKGNLGDAMKKTIIDAIPAKTVKLNYHEQRELFKRVEKEIEKQRQNRQEGQTTIPPEKKYIRFFLDLESNDIRGSMEKLIFVILVDMSVEILTDPGIKDKQKIFKSVRNLINSVRNKFMKDKEIYVKRRMDLFDLNYDEYKKSNMDLLAFIKKNYKHDPDKIREKIENLDKPKNSRRSKNRSMKSVVNRYMLIKEFLSMNDIDRESSSKQSTTSKQSSKKSTTSKQSKKSTTSKQSKKSTTRISEEDIETIVLSN
jgi:hypothetical protein